MQIAIPRSWNGGADRYNGRARKSAERHARRAATRAGLPKTRSGKIMRPILRKIAKGMWGIWGDTSTLADPAVVEDLLKGRPK